MESAVGSQSADKTLVRIGDHVLPPSALHVRSTKRINTGTPVHEVVAAGFGGGLLVALAVRDGEHVSGFGQRAWMELNGSALHETREGCLSDRHTLK